MSISGKSVFLSKKKNFNFIKVFYLNLNLKFSWSQVEIPLFGQKAELSTFHFIAKFCSPQNLNFSTEFRPWNPLFRHIRIMNKKPGWFSLSIKNIHFETVQMQNKWLFKNAIKKNNCKLVFLGLQQVTHIRSDMKAHEKVIILIKN